jgi:CRISPR-associated protein Cas2
MYVILVYDIKEERVSKILKICRKYLNWVQNSVLEGEITEAKLEKLKFELKEKMAEEEDSVIIYKFRTLLYSDREIIGIRKGGEELIV